MITSIPDENAQPQPTQGEMTFDDMAASMPDTAQGFLDQPLIQPTSDEPLIVDDSAQIAEEKKTKTVRMSRKMKKAMEKLKDKAANGPIMYFHTKAKNNPEWELDEDEKEMLRDSISTVFELLDINVEIEPLEWTLSSIWWVISYPLVVFGALFMMKKSQQLEREQRPPDNV